MNSIDPEKFEQFVQMIHPENKLLHAWKLHGGVSAQVTAFEVLLPDGNVKKMVVRQHGEIDRKRNPNIAADEFKLLKILKAQGIPVPTPYFFDQAGGLFPTPFIVIEFIEGQTDFNPGNINDTIHQLATTLAKLHQIDCTQLDFSFLPKQENLFAEKLATKPVVYDDSLHENKIRSALEKVWPLSQMNKGTILHGDFWPGNIMWNDGKLLSIIDWEDAAYGDPLADFANGRLEILFAFGMEAMVNFTNQYKALMTEINFSILPYWDLCAALRLASSMSEWGLDESTEKLMRDRYQVFVTQALGEISSKCNIF